MRILRRLMGSWRLLLLTSTLMAPSSSFSTRDSASAKALSLSLSLSESFLESPLISAYQKTKNGCWHEKERDYSYVISYIPWYLVDLRRSVMKHHISYSTKLSLMMKNDRSSIWNIHIPRVTTRDNELYSRYDQRSYNTKSLGQIVQLWETSSWTRMELANRNWIAK